MTTSGNDFDVAKAVADQLKGVEKEHQQRILRWVAESLGLELGVASAAERGLGDMRAPTEGSATQHGDAPAHRHARSVDIKSFVDVKAPKSDVQFAAVVAYYYRFEAPVEARKESIDAQVLQEAARLTGRRRSPKPLATLNNAKNLGYLDSPGRGQFGINSVGENLVAMTLPSSQTERPRAKVRSPKVRKAKPKKR